LPEWSITADTSEARASEVARVSTAGLARSFHSHHSATEHVRRCDRLGGLIHEYQQGGNPEVIAKAAQSAVGVGTQAPTAADWTIGSDTGQTAKDAGGWVSGGIAARQSAGEWGDAGKGTGEAWESIKSFARAVG
jgi:hypothetical protein